MLFELEGLLRAGNVSKSLEVMRNWLAAAEPGEPELMLSEAVESARPKLALLMRDLLSRYPSTIVGAPMLLYAQPDYEATGLWGGSLKLPFPEPKYAQPCSDLHFLGWLPSSTQLPVAMPFRPEHHEVSVAWGKPTCVVALFRSHPELFDLDSIEMPNHWWGHLFQSTQANIHLTARAILPYPDALEATQVMAEYCRGNPVPNRGRFLSDTAWTMACDEAALFKESCRHAFKPH